MPGEVFVVKPLEWREISLSGGSVRHVATTPFGILSVLDDAAGLVFHHWPGECQVFCEAVELGKDILADRYRDRLLTALSPVPLSELERIVQERGEGKP